MLIACKETRDVTTHMTNNKLGGSPISICLLWFCRFSFLWTRCTQQSVRYSTQVASYSLRS